MLMFILHWLIRHVEKIAALVFLGIAISIALRGFLYVPLTWTPASLHEQADSTETIIKNNARTAADENVQVFDFASYAEEIKTPIITDPYRNITAWCPLLYPDRLPHSGFDVFPIVSFKGESVRQISSVTSSGFASERWRRPLLSSASSTIQHSSSEPESSIWVNLYGTIPLEMQWEAYNQSFNDTAGPMMPVYAYYELERAEQQGQAVPNWQPTIVYPNSPPVSDITADRLIPMESLLARHNNNNGTVASPRDIRNVLLYSDYSVNPGKTYIYRSRVYIANPNYNIQESYVEPGVDTVSRYLVSDWSFFCRVYVPDRTTVRLASVTPSDLSDFPRQHISLGTIRGTLLLDYYDTDSRQLLPPIEKSRMIRGMLCNAVREEVNRSANRNGTGESLVPSGYPESGLQSDVCVLDLSGGKKLQRRASRDSQGTPDLFTEGKSLLLLPDGTMQTISVSP